MESPGYVVVEVNPDSPDGLYGLVPEFYATVEEAQHHATLFTTIAQGNPANKNIQYLACQLVPREEET